MIEYWDAAKSGPNVSSSSSSSCIFRPGYRSSCCTRPPGRSWPRWGKPGWGWGWWVYCRAGPQTPPVCWCSWRKSACVCGWCSSPPVGWASSSARGGTLFLCTEWRGGTHWGQKEKDERKFYSYLWKNLRLDRVFTLEHQHTLNEMPDVSVFFFEANK